MRTMALGLVLGMAMPALGQVIGPPVLGITPTVSTLTTGTILQAQVTVSADQRYVTMQIQPTQSSLEGLSTFSLSGQLIGGTGSGNGGGGGGGAGSAGLVRVREPVMVAEPGSVVFADLDKKLLAAEVPAMTLRNKSLKDAVKSLADATKSNVVLGVRGMEQAGVNVNAGHDFAIAHGTLKDALEGVLRAAAPKVDVVVTAEDGVVEVMSQAQADNVVVTRTYYEEDLVANLPKILAKQTDLYTLEGEAKATKRTPAGQPNYEDVVGYREPGRAAAIMAAGGQVQYSTNVMEMIISAVRPEIWKVNGGKIGEISEVGNQVTVRAPLSVQAVLDGPKVYDPNARPVNVGYDAGSGGAHVLP